MDIVWANTGIWVCCAVVLVILTPIVLEFSKRNLPVVFGVILFILVLHGLSDQSPEMQSLWFKLKLVPSLLYSGMQSLFKGLFL